MNKHGLLTAALAAAMLAAGFLGLANAARVQADSSSPLLSQALLAGACGAPGQPGTPGQPGGAGGAGGNGGNGGNGGSCLPSGLSLGNLNLQSLAITDCGTLSATAGQTFDPSSTCYLLPTGQSIVMAPNGSVSVLLPAGLMALPALGSLTCSGQPGAPGQPGAGGSGGAGGAGGNGGSCLSGGNGGNGGNGG